MQILWMITNPDSGSAGASRCQAIEAVLHECGVTLAGRTVFPRDTLPGTAVLRAANVDTVLLFAGDGTINAALCTLASWDGAVLILPGGTMNMLARQLHGSRAPEAIVREAHAKECRIALPYVEAGPHRAFVGLILGPAASWFAARETVRKRRIARLTSAVRQAWRHTFRETVRVQGAPHLVGKYQAIFISPQRHGLEASAIDAHDWRSILALGWDWLAGDWVSSRAVTRQQASRLTVAGRRPALALFDGELQMLAIGTGIGGGVTGAVFLTTQDDAA